MTGCLPAKERSLHSLDRLTTEEMEAVTPTSKSVAQFAQAGILRK